MSCYAVEVYRNEVVLTSPSFRGVGHMSVWYMSQKNDILYRNRNYIITSFSGIVKYRNANKS